MYDLLIIAVFGLAAFLVAWVVNGLVGLMMGEHPGDTGRSGAEIFLRMFAVLELGLIGRMLNSLGLTGWPRKLVLFVGLLCVLLFLVKGCQARPGSRTACRPSPTGTAEALQVQQVFRPYGTWNGLRMLHPALKRWAIFGEGRIDHGWARMGTDKKTQSKRGTLVIFLCSHGDGGHLSRRDAAKHIGMVPTGNSPAAASEWARSIPTASHAFLAAARRIHR